MNKDQQRLRPRAVHRQRGITSGIALGIILALIGGPAIPGYAFEDDQPTYSESEISSPAPDEVVEDQESRQEGTEDSDDEVELPLEDGEELVTPDEQTTPDQVEDVDQAKDVPESEMPATNSDAEPANAPSIAPFMVATGGNGRYRNVIDWAQWGAVGRRINNTSDVSWTKPIAAGAGYWISTRCVISAVKDNTPAYPIGYPKFAGEGPGGRNPAGPANPLKTYAAGGWSGDGLDNLYNVGGTGTNNTLVNAIAVDEYASNSQLRRYDVTVEFQFDCGAWLISSATSPTLNSATSTSSFTTVPLEGLVFADAESNNWYPASGAFNGSQQEYISVTPNAASGQSATWRLLDSYKTPRCATNSVAEFMNGGSTLKFRSDGIQCATLPGFPAGGEGPSSAMFLQGSKSAKVEVRGGGQGAVALGAIISMDFGDAPQSYSSAAALFEPAWQGGVVSAPGVQNNLSAMRSANDVAVMDTPKTILGKVIDGEIEAHYSAGANWDDLDGTDDEDGVTFQQKIAGRDAIVPTTTPAGKLAFSQNVTCVGPGDVAAWIDWDRNGTFNDDEKSTQIPCVNGNATLTWELPADAKDSVEGETGSAATFMRVRITNQTTANGSVVSIPATGLTTTSGEVEDYKVNVYLPRAAHITVKKMIVPSDAPAGSIAGAVPAGNDWEFGLPAGWSPAAGLTVAPNRVTTDVEGRAKFELQFARSLNSGEVRLDEKQKPGYEVVPVNGKNAVCESLPTKAGVAVGSFAGTAANPGFNLTATPGQTLECTMYNRKLAYDLSWNKVDGSDSSVVLSGSEWTLTPYINGELITADTIVVEDCVATNAADCGGADKDPAAGKFLLKGLSPGKYALEETQAPAGYQLLTEPIDVVINTNYALGDIENFQSDVPQLPLTGGMGTFAIFLGAGGIGALVLAALALQRRRSRMSIG